MISLAATARCATLCVATLFPPGASSPALALPQFLRCACERRCVRIELRSRRSHVERARSRFVARAPLRPGRRARLDEAEQEQGEAMLAGAAVTLGAACQ